MTPSLQRTLHGTGDHPKLLLISMDGFRWDYLTKRGNFPNLRQIKDTGVSASRGLKNVFLTKTLVNHYSILTGLYAESHGITGNIFYDSGLKQQFNSFINTTQLTDSRWFDVGAEPIWATNQKASPSRHSGSVMFWGSDARVKGFIPTHHVPFNISTPFKNRTDMILDWFTAQNPINLGLLYFNEPDHTGHIYGPDSKEVIQKIEELDAEIDHLLKRLKEENLIDKMDIIITSDHGMTSLINDTEHAIDLNNYINIETYEIDSTRPVATIRAKNKDLEAEIIKNLSNVNHLHLYRKQDIPGDYHYKKGPRIDPIVAEPDEHYFIMYNNTPAILGEHGYNNSMQSMHPFFIATGPSFKTGYSVETFNTVDLYPLMCLLLDIPAAPNNGSLAVVKSLLKDEIKSTKEGIPAWAYVVILIVFIVVGGLFAFAACRVQKKNQRKTAGALHETTGIRYRDLNKDEVPLVDDFSDDELDTR